MVTEGWLHSEKIASIRNNKSNGGAYSPRGKFSKIAEGVQETSPRIKFFKTKKPMVTVSPSIKDAPRERAISNSEKYVASPKKEK